MNLISVIIPLYNAENFVLKAYNFITEQKHLNIPLEIIFVDNNSKDNSYEIATQLAMSDKRVMVYKEKKQGAPAARNKGFLMSRGNFLYFYDADDQLFEDALSSLSNVLLRDEGVDAVFGKFIRSHEDIDKIAKETLEQNAEVYYYNQPYLGLLWFNDLSKTVGPPGFLYRRKVFEDLGMYNTKIPASEDTALDIELGMNYNVAKINKYVYLYFKHDSATTTILKKKKSRAFMQWPRIIFSHIPFHLRNTDKKEYSDILKRKIYSSIAKMIDETEGYDNRVFLRKQLYEDIIPLKLPIFIDFYVRTLCMFNNTYLLKFYLYYIIPLFTKNLELKESKYRTIQFTEQEK